ncbi:hypothetical protein [Lentibacillus sp. CBA3610]|nr:hypothetical protein [Lentibacillus sp. CBA3610]
MNAGFAKLIISIKNSIQKDMPKNKTDWGYLCMFTGALVFLYVSLINA